MNNLEKIRELTEALEAVRPWAVYYHERMACFVGDTWDKMDQEEKKQYPFVLQMFFKYLDDAERLRQQIDSALAVAVEEEIN